MPVQLDHFQVPAWIHSRLYIFSQVGAKTILLVTLERGFGCPPERAQAVVGRSNQSGGRFRPGRNKTLNDFPLEGIIFLFVSMHFWSLPFGFVSSYSSIKISFGIKSEY